MNDPTTADDAGEGSGEDFAVTSTELDQLRVVVTLGDGEVVLALSGELDPHTAPLLHQEIDRVVSAGATVVVLDMSGVDFIDSSGLRVIIGARRRVDDLAGTLRLRSPSPTVRRLLEITGLVDHIAIEMSEP